MILERWRISSERGRQEGGRPSGHRLEDRVHVPCGPGGLEQGTRHHGALDDEALGLDDVFSVGKARVGLDQVAIDELLGPLEKAAELANESYETPVPEQRQAIEAAMRIGAKLAPAMEANPASMEPVKSMTTAPAIMLSDAGT